MKQKHAIIVILLSMALLSSCAYQGYEFEIDELSYRPLERTGQSPSQTDDEWDESSGTYRTSGGGRTQSDMGPLEGTLRVDVTSPSNAIIRLDGESIGDSYVEHTLVPGSYLLEVESEGYAPYVSNVIMNPRAAASYRIRLYPEWLPPEERIRIDSFASDSFEVRKGDEVSLNAKFSGPPDVVCEMLLGGRQIGRFTQRNVEHAITHAFENHGREEIRLRCSGLVGEQSQTLTIEVHECIDDNDCPYRCTHNRCVEEYRERIDMQVEYFDRVFLWFGRWKEYHGDELRPRTRVRMVVNALPPGMECATIGTDISIRENSRSKPILLTRPAAVGIACDNGQEEIVNINVRVEGGIIGELID
jgi:hypothetical protein